MFLRIRYATARVSREVDPITQFFMWSCIDMMPEDQDQDYLQVFDLTATAEGQKIVHTQEVPPYSREYLILCRNPITAKIFVIDDVEYATMLFAEEY